MKHVLSVVAFMVISFMVQGLNHFVINKAHYAAIDFARAEPVIALSVLTMIVQGVILSFAMSRITTAGRQIKDGLLVSLSFGLFLAVYIALAEPAKYTAPSIVSWAVTEGFASTIQFILYGIALGLIHRKLS
jgi:hypothetical protein